MYSDWLSLELHQACDGDVYKDVVRIHETKRNGIKSGTICRLYMKDGKDIPIVVRGIINSDKKNYILIDEVTRERLEIDKLPIGAKITLRIRDGNVWDKIIWAAWASDPALRISMLIAFVSLALGVIALAIELLKPLSDR